MKKYNKKIEEKILLENDKFILRCDCNGKIIIKNLCKLEDKALLKLSDVISKLNNVDMSKRERNIYIQGIVDTSCLVNLDEDLAMENIEILEKDIEQELRLKKRLQYVFTAVSIFSVLIIVCLFLSKTYKDISYILIYSSLGGILAILYKQDSVDIDYIIATYAIILEALKRVVMTIVVGAIGFIAIKAGIILPSLGDISNKYTLALVMVICGYSINFVPNILDKMLASNNSQS